MDWQAHLKEVAAWLVRLRQEPAWADYAKKREDELLDSPMYWDVPSFIRELRTEAKK